MHTTRLSSKGQIIIPQSIRQENHWGAGVEFFVVQSKQGILLTPIKKQQKSSSIQEIIGCTGYKGKKKSLKSMEQGIAKGAKRNK